MSDLTPEEAEALARVPLFRFLMEEWAAVARAFAQWIDGAGVGIVRWLERPDGSRIERDELIDDPYESTS